MGKFGWMALLYWAELLEEKYPRTNLMAVSHEKLSEMLLSLDEAVGMPPLPEMKSYFSALMDAWIEVQYGKDSSKDIPDAYK